MSDGLVDAQRRSGDMRATASVGSPAASVPAVTKRGPKDLGELTEIVVHRQDPKNHRLLTFVQSVPGSTTDAWLARCLTPGRYRLEGRDDRFRYLWVRVLVVRADGTGEAAPKGEWKRKSRRRIPPCRPLEPPPWDR